MITTGPRELHRVCVGHSMRSCPGDFVVEGLVPGVSRNHARFIVRSLRRSRNSEF
jgi:hypothetical protein